MWKGFKEFFTYSRKQRNGLLALVFIALLLQVFLYFNDFWPKPAAQGFEEFKTYVDEWANKDSLARLAHMAPADLFYFDPNFASDSALQQLGFSPRLAATIIKYRSKGGRFRKPKDLEKIYGMDSLLYQQLRPFVKIKEERYPAEGGQARYTFKAFELNEVSQKELVQMGLPPWEAKRIVTYRQKVHPYKNAEELFRVYNLDSALVEAMLPYAKVDTNLAQPPKEEKPMAVVEINSADSIQLLALRGIGPSYAKRILKYRSMLGGFYAKEQLLEVYGMEEERLSGFESQITIDKNGLKKIDVNTATFKELLRHPYLEYEVVKNIVNFREKVRPFRSVEELRNIELINEVLFSKIANYVTISEKASQ